jgi:hypothetical protein
VELLNYPKLLNQDVVIMSGGNLQSKELHTSQTSINVSVRKCRNTC